MNLNLELCPYFNTAKLGSLITVLSVISPDTTVEYDFCYLSPTKLDSYRGYYDHLALGWSEPNPWPSVQQVLDELKSAVGKTFHGWKGGEYTMDESTPVWVANPGQTGSTGIVGVELQYGSVILITKRLPT